MRFRQHTEEKDKQENGGEPRYVKGVPIMPEVDPMDQIDEPEQDHEEKESVDIQAKDFSLEQTLMFDPNSASSLIGATDLPPAWAWAETNIDLKENLVSVVLGQSIKSDIEQITFKKMGVMPVGAIKARLTDILLMRKERLVVYAVCDQCKPLQEWQMASHNLVVDDSLTILTPSNDFVNVSSVEWSITLMFEPLLAAHDRP